MSPDQTLNCVNGSDLSQRGFGQVDYSSSDRNYSPINEYLNEIFKFVFLYIMTITFNVISACSDFILDFPKMLKIGKIKTSFGLGMTLL